MPAEGMLGGYTISGDRVGTDEHPLVRKHLPIDTTVVTTVLEPGVLLKEVEVKGEEDESEIEHLNVEVDPDDAGDLPDTDDLDDIDDDEVDEGDDAEEADSSEEVIPPKDPKQN